MSSLLSHPTFNWKVRHGVPSMNQICIRLFKLNERLIRGSLKTVKTKKTRVTFQFYGRQNSAPPT